MMHRDRRHRCGLPRPGDDVEDLHRLWGLTTADEIEALACLDVSGLEARDMLANNLEARGLRARFWRQFRH